MRPQAAAVRMIIRPVGQARGLSHPTYFHAQETKSPAIRPRGDTAGAPRAITQAEVVAVGDDSAGLGYRSRLRRLVDLPAGRRSDHLRRPSIVHRLPPGSLRRLAGLASRSGDGPRHARDRFGRFQRRGNRAIRYPFPHVPARRQVLDPHRRCGREVGRLRSQMGVWRRSIAAVHGRVRPSGGYAKARDLARPSVADLLGYPTQAVVLPASAGRSRAAGAGRRSALDGHRPALEQHAARTATRPICRRITTWPRTPTTRRSRKSMSAAKPATGRAACTWSWRTASRCFGTANEATACLG